MQQIIYFLNENKIGFLATIDGILPRVRPWGFMFADNGKFWFLTSNQKKVYQQLKENPYIEFCSISDTYDHVRLNGKIEFSDDMEIKNRILQERPLLKALYQSPNNPVLAAFYLEHGTAFLVHCSGENDEFFEF